MTTKLRAIQWASGNIGSHTAAAIRGSRIAIYDGDDSDHGYLGTAMHAVNAIAPVCAPPGIRIFLDLTTIASRECS